MEDFAIFEIAKKLKEKGFTCEMPFAMYNELGVFHLLTTSAPYNVCSSGYKCREYYDYEDFDEYDFIAPTISQVLKWLRGDKGLHICISLGEFSDWDYEIALIDGNILCAVCEDSYPSYEQAALAGIEYCLDNLI